MDFKNGNVAITGILSDDTTTATAVVLKPFNFESILGANDGEVTVNVDVKFWNPKATIAQGNFNGRFLNM